MRDLEWYEEAVSHLEEAVEVNRKTGERLLLGHSLAILGEIRLDHGDVARVRLYRARLLRGRRAQICSGNLLRAWRRVEDVAAELQAGA